MFLHQVIYGYGTKCYTVPSNSSFPLSSSLPPYMWSLSPISWVPFQRCFCTCLAPIKHFPIAKRRLFFKWLVSGSRGKLHHFHYLHFYKNLIVLKHHFLHMFIPPADKISVTSTVSWKDRKLLSLVYKVLYNLIP